MTEVKLAKIYKSKSKEHTIYKLVVTTLNVTKNTTKLCLTNSAVNNRFLNNQWQAK